MAYQGRRLPEAELEIMLAIWKHEDPVTSSTILEQLQGRRSWALPTLMTVLSRLCDKGFLCCQKQGRYNMYSALVSESDYRATEGKSLLSRLYSGSVPALVASLYQSKAINRQDLAELRRFLDELEEKES